MKHEFQMIKILGKCWEKVIRNRKRTNILEFLMTVHKYTFNV